MRDIRADLRERLAATVRQRIELEARESRLQELLRDEEVSQPLRIQPASCPGSKQPTDGPRLREFVLGSLKDGHEWSLEALKEHACGIGLTTAGASGRALSITLVNLFRQGLVTRGPAGKWRLRDHSTQLPLDLVPLSTASHEDAAGGRLAS
jgi:hypothetical protein